MKRIGGFLLSLILTLSCFSSKLSAEEFVIITSSTNATVIEVIDGDAIMVRLPNGNTALVRLIGVDTAGYNGAYEYLTQELLGSNVYLTTDYAVWSSAERWNKMYVYKNGQLINSKIIAAGFGKINPDDFNATLYRTLLTDESNAKYDQIGIWNEGFTSGVYVYGNRVNINTASLQQIKDVLKVSNNTLPNAVIRYRERHPFETVGEIKFVNGMTKEIYDQSYMRLTVCTNINTASVDELATLASVTRAMAQDVMNYRAKHRFGNIVDLYDEDLMSKHVYDLNKNFISTKDVSWIAYAEPNYTVNIATATDTQLSAAGLNSTQIKRVLDNRTDYTFKSLYDLQNVDSMNFTDQNINYLADNLHIYTELNNATEYEIRSLFGKSFDRATLDDIIDHRPYRNVDALKYYIGYDYFNRLSPYLYVDTPTAEYVNLNTATVSQLVSAGFSQTQANTIYAKQGRMLTPKDIPVDVSSKNMSVSLFTNINTASFKELESLSVYMTPYIINRVISYRDDQPFGSVDEIREFFNGMGNIGVFNTFSDFIVVR